MSAQSVLETCECQKYLLNTCVFKTWHLIKGHAWTTEHSADEGTVRIRNPSADTDERTAYYVSEDKEACTDLYQKTLK